MTKQSDISLRAARPEDAAQLLAIYRPYVMETAISFEYEAPSEAEFRARIEKTLAHYPYIVAECAAKHSATPMPRRSIRAPLMPGRQKAPSTSKRTCTAPASAKGFISPWSRSFAV